MAATLDDPPVPIALETIRALRAARVDDPFAALRIDLRERLTSTSQSNGETRELLLLVEALTALTAEAEAAALLPY